MKKIWKIIEPNKYNSFNEILKDLKKNKIIISPWIEDIINNKKNKLIINKKKNLSI